MKALSIFAIVFAAALLVACGNKAAPTTDTNQMPPAPGNDAKPTTEQGSAPDTPQAAPVKTDDAKAAFTKAMGAVVEYQVNYDLTSVAAGKTIKSSNIQYVQGTSADNYKYRMDTSFGGIETRMYAIDKEYTTCTRYGGEWACFTPKTGEEQSTPQEQAADATTVTADGTMSVAGVTADCYRATTEQGSAKYCIYKSIPLYIKTMDKSGVTESEMTATSYKTTVADSVFTLPAKPSSDPGSMYGGAAGGTFPTGQVPEGYDLPNY